MKLEGKNIVIGVTGGIAVYKACQVVRLFKKLGANVDVIMTEHATQFVAPLTFETLSNRPVVTDMFNRNSNWEVEHISLAKKADIFVVCPATANIIGKYANGIADDMLSTTLMATTAPVVIAPAMNTNMYHSPALVQNVNTLKQRGVYVMNTGTGFLACKDYGDGRMAEPQEIVDYAVNVLCNNCDLSGKRILITAGATIEKLDDVRYVTNFSSGKMGLAIAKRAISRGAEVKVVLANHTVDYFGIDTVSVTTTNEMYEKVMELYKDYDVIIMSAAPCDYRPMNYSESKIKSQQLTVQFVKNVDIAESVGKVKGDRYLVVFSAETDHALENATAKRIKKHADLCVLNDVKNNNVFGNDTNVVTLIDDNGTVAYDEMSKYDVADIILNKVIEA